MRVRCFCLKCHGTFVSPQTKLNHQRRQLRTQTISEQLQLRCEVLPATQHDAGPSSLGSSTQLCLPGISAHSPDISGPPSRSGELETLAQPSISVPDLDSFAHANVIYDSDSASRVPSNLVNVNPEYAPEGEDDFSDKDTILDADRGDEGDQLSPPGPIASDPTKDCNNPDPFVVESHDRRGIADLQEPEIPSHLRAVYTLVTWLHLQFHLPHVACNVVLAFLAFFFTFFKLALMPPFTTIQSATRALGINPNTQLLAVCKKCRRVYPSSDSIHMQDNCTTCDIPLFSPELTRQGNHRVTKTLEIKYPYLSLSDQIAS